MAGSASFLWVAAGLVGLVTVAPGIDQVVGEIAAEDAAVGTAIPRAPDGQFYIEARAGDEPIRFLVDGGIEGVVLAPADAERVGVGGAEDAQLAGLIVGSRRLDQVPARIGAGLPVSLIGRSTLARDAGAQFTRDRLVLP